MVSSREASLFPFRFPSPFVRACRDSTVFVSISFLSYVCISLLIPADFVFFLLFDFREKLGGHFSFSFVFVFVSSCMQTSPFPPSLFSFFSSLLVLFFFVLVFFFFPFFALVSPYCRCRSQFSFSFTAADMDKGTYTRKKHIHGWGDKGQGAVGFTHEWLVGRVNLLSRFLSLSLSCFVFFWMDDIVSALPKGFVVAAGLCVNLLSLYDCCLGIF